MFNISLKSKNKYYELWLKFKYSNILIPIVVCLVVNHHCLEFAFSVSCAFIIHNKTINVIGNSTFVYVIKIVCYVFLCERIKIQSKNQVGISVGFYQMSHKCIYEICIEPLVLDTLGLL